MIPYVAKPGLTIIALGDALEANAVRATLEGLNYHTTTHWLGSRAFLRTYDVPLSEAVQRAAAFHPECEQFVLS